MTSSKARLISDAALSFDLPGFHSMYKHLLVLSVSTHVLFVFNLCTKYPVYSQLRVYC